MSVKDQVLTIIARQALVDVSDLKPETTLDALGIDSLGLVEAVFAIEETFDISVPYNANQTRDDVVEGEFNITNIAAIVAAVEGLVANA